jgi:hypothetical protein
MRNDYRGILNILTQIAFILAAFVPAQRVAALEDRAAGRARRWSGPNNGDICDRRVRTLSPATSYRVPSRVRHIADRLGHKIHGRTPALKINR